MLLFVAFAACMPAHAAALNDLSSMPPVSVTMQPRNLVLLAAAVPLDEADVLDDEGELVLLPQAATASVADTASATVAHALCFTLTSTGPARRRAWPRLRPGLSRRLCLVAPPGKRTRPYLACSLPNRNRIMMALLACQTYIRAFGPRTLVLSYRLTTSCVEALVLVTALAGAPVLGAGAPGKSRETVRPPPDPSKSRSRVSGRRRR